MSEAVGPRGEAGATGRRAPRTVAVVLAGGTGSRVGLKIPKQLLKIAGKPIIEHTIAALSSYPEVDEVLVLMTPGFVSEVERIVERGGYHKVSRVLEGGATRPGTTYRALTALGDTDCNVLLHDAVRPLVDHRIVADCVEALRTYEAVDVAIPSSDTIIVVDGAPNGEVITEVPSRERLRRGQTPQCFRLSTIRRAYDLAMSDPGFTATDDCTVVLRYLPEVPIYVVPGSEHNMKITHPVDVFLADKLFQLASHSVERSGSPEEYAGRLRGKTLVVFGGSYGIGGDIAHLARGFGADVFSFSRSQTGTYVENPGHVEAALRQAHAKTGRIDYVVDTAGALRTGRLAETDEATIEEMVKVNYLAPITIARAAAPYLAETHGQLLLYTSSSYTRGRAEYSLYSSTKAAVVNLTQALADEWSELGVRVNCVNPERTQTPMRLRAFGEEPPETLLSCRAVALTSIDVLISDLTGHVIDVRRHEPPGAGALSRSDGEVERIGAALAAAEEAAAEAVADAEGLAMAWWSGVSQP